MKERQQFELWKEQLIYEIQNKVEEFHFLGYDKATKEEIWECTLYQLRKEKDFIHLNAFVNTLLNLKPQLYMNWLTAQAYKDPTDWFSDYEDREN